MNLISQEILARQDKEARALAQREFSLPLALEAGAGTGKTSILTARLISWCLGPGWEKVQRDLRGENNEDRMAARVLSKVVAITFTEAAASEMGAKVAKALAELEAGKLPIGVDPEVLPQDPDTCSKRARALLAGLDHLAVHTIHAFCLRLLSRFPLEAGLHPQLVVDPDGMLLEEMARELVEACLAFQGDWKEKGDLLELLQEGVSPRDILETLVDLAQEAVPLEALSKPPFSSSRIIQMKKEFCDCLERFFRAGGSALKGAQRRSSTTSSVFEALESAKHLLENLGSPTPQELERACDEIRKLWEDKLSSRLQDWARGEFNTVEEKILAGSHDRLQQEASELQGWISYLCRMRPLFLTKAAGVLAKLLEQLYAQMRSRGVLSFGGILRGARDLLASNPQVLSQVRDSIEQLLVDEFQDTDVLQCEIIRMIALEGPLEKRPGLFIVGDPKQSIYGWRNADLAAYDSFVKELEEKGGRKLLLSVNFRSVPAILNEVERAIQPIMKKAEGLQPEFQPLLPCENLKDQEGFCHGAWSAVEYWLCQKVEPDGNNSKNSTTKGEATQLEAKAVAWDILRLHREKGLKWSDVGILLRSTSDLDVYLEALKEAGVPYWVSSEKNYYQRREVLEATALVRAVLDPMDQLALVAFLRSCTVGVPDAAWIPLWAKGFAGLMAELKGPDPERLQLIRDKVLEVASHVPPSVSGLERIPGWESALLAAVETIARLRNSFQVEPQDLFVKQIVDSTLLEVTEAAKYLGSYRLANLEKFFHSLLCLLEKVPGNVHSVLRMVRSSVVRERKAEEGVPQEAVEDAVRVMTIHKAKGLDFSHVYVLQAHKSVQRDSKPRTCAKLWADQWELCLFGWPSPGYWRLERRTQEVSLAETIRTLYVAMTRAKDRLVIAGNFQQNKADSELTYAGLLRTRLRSIEDPRNIREKCSHGDSQKGICMGTGVFLRLPGLWPLEKEQALAQAKDQDVSCLVEQASREAEMLRALKKQALCRMHRPWQEAMSKEAHQALEEGWGHASGILVGEEEAVGRAPAMLLGRIVHKALETLSLGENLQEELQRLENWSKEQVLALFSQEEAPRALVRLQAVWKGIRGGRILRRLKEIGPHVVARELPVLLAPPVEDQGPVGVYAGFIDLLYTDPTGQRWVVADYKTDMVSGPQDMLRLGHVYRSQGAYYARAVREMMQLDQEPRFELWFLSADEICEVTT